MKNKFSVLMSVYKNDKLDDIVVAINSLLNQTLKANQIVIMIDGPVSQEIEDKLDYFENENKVIEVHKNEINIGLGKILNEGLKYCKYDYVARMDSDDYCNENRFEKQFEVLNNDPNIDLIGCCIDEYDNTLTKFITKKMVPETNEQIKKYIKNRNPMNHMTVVFKKDKVLNAGSYEDCFLFEDYYLWCRMSINNCQFYNIQEPLMKVRAGYDMLTRRGGFKYVKCIINFQKKIKKLNIINGIELTKNTISRSLIAISPVFIRKFIYEKKLRESKNEKN